MPALLRTAVALAALVAALGLLAGCGDSESDGGDGGGAATQVDPDASPSEVFLAFHDDLAAGNAEEACAALAPSAIEQTEVSSLGGTCEDWVEEVKSFIVGPARKKYENTKIRDEQIEGSSATISYQDPVLPFPNTVELEQSDGAWLISKLNSFVE